MYAAGAFDRIDVTLGGFWGSLPAGSPLFPYLSHDPAECVDNEVTASVYRSAKMGLNFYRVADGDSYTEGVACGPREIEMAACGLPFLRDSRPESDELFGEILPPFHSPEEAAEQLSWWLAHDEDREDAAWALRDAVRPRTFTANAQRLLEIIAEL
jgi:hypothetical protein